MKKYYLILVLILLAAGVSSCNNSSNNEKQENKTEATSIDASVLGVQLGLSKSAAIDSLDKGQVDFDATPGVSCEVTGPVPFADTVSFATAHLQFAKDVVTGISCESAYPESAYPDKGKSAQAFYNQLNGILTSKYKKFAAKENAGGATAAKYDDHKTLVTVTLNHVAATDSVEASWLVKLDIAPSGNAAQAE